MQIIRDLENIRKNTRNITDQGENRTEPRILVGMATCGIAAGAQPIYDALEEELEALGLSDITITKTGCVGACEQEPIVDVIMPGQKKVTYIKMTPEKTKEVVQQHIRDGYAVKDYTTTPILDEGDFFKKQKRITLDNCGKIDPESIDEYLSIGGYTALEKVLKDMQPDQVVSLIKDSGLRGRGGGGFSAGQKWEFTLKAQGYPKYVVCNADEGDPGAFMDRSILEGDPLSVIEAMTIAGYAIGGNEGYIYIRAEYPLAVERLEIAIAQAKEYGLLGKNIMGTGFDFDLKLSLGAGAFVCGEETALMNSIEGKRGISTQKPPFPAQSGLWGKPTLINNVETFGNITDIINNGSEWFKSIGTEKSAGTKVFALGGKVNNTGLVEIPMGTTLREVIYEIGGGIPKNKEFKAIQTGGPSGGCIPAEYLDTPIDYESLQELGSMMGSGGMIVMDDDNCMVDIARFFLDFTVDESCGKCTPCREGTKRMLEILDKIIAGQGEMEDIDRLESLATTITSTSLCGLGQSAPNPVVSTLKYFREEYQAHVRDKKCPAGSCQELLEFYITDDCIGCTKCKKDCPTNCIDGKVKEKHVIRIEDCIKCGNCVVVCPTNAVIKQ